MKLHEDILTTYKIAKNPGSNWRAIHTGSAFFVGCGSIFSSAFFLASDWPSLFRARWMLVLGLACIAYWRFLLPEAKRIAGIKRILSNNNT